MKNFERVNDHIYSLRIPYMDIFTTVYLVRTESGMLLFDTASYDQDVEEYIVPALRELGVGEKELKYVFVSHDHTDHSGGLGRLLEVYPKVCVASGSEAIGEKFKEYTVLSPREGEILLANDSICPLNRSSARSRHSPDIESGSPDRCLCA